jgi:hypothetical protein
MSARIRAGSRFKRCLCCFDVVKCFSVPAGVLVTQVEDHWHSLNEVCYRVPLIIIRGIINKDISKLKN